VYRIFSLISNDKKRSKIFDDFDNIEDQYKELLECIISSRLINDDIVEDVRKIK
jgi:hypothetical protein